MSRINKRLAVRDFIHKTLGLTGTSYTYDAECKVKRVKAKNGEIIKECTIFLIDSKTGNVVYVSPVHDFNTPHFSIDENQLMQLAVLIHEDIKNKQ